MLLNTHQVFKWFFLYFSWVFFVGFDVNPFPGNPRILIDNVNVVSFTRQMESMYQVSSSKLRVFFIPSPFIVDNDDSLAKMAVTERLGVAQVVIIVKFL